VAAHVPADQAARIADSLLVGLRSGLDPDTEGAIFGALGEVAARVPADQAARITAVLLDRLKTEPDSPSWWRPVAERSCATRDRIAAALGQVARHVPAEQGWRIAEGLVERLMIEGRFCTDTAQKALAKVAGHLPADQATRIADELLSCLASDPDHAGALSNAEIVGAVACYVSADRVGRIADALVDHLVSYRDDFACLHIGHTLDALAGYVPVEHAARIAEVLHQGLVAQSNWSVQEDIGDALSAFIGYVPAEQAARIGGAWVPLLNAHWGECGCYSPGQHVAAAAKAGVRWRQKLAPPKWVSHARSLARGAPIAAAELGRPGL
jgi:hypothetical protein